MILVYTGNHLSMLPIADNVECLVEILEKEGHHVIVSREWRRYVDTVRCLFVIENFCDIHDIYIHEMLSACRRVGIKLMLLHTEFYGSGFTLNNFSTLDSMVNSWIPVELIKHYYCNRESYLSSLFLGIWALVFCCIQVKILVYRHSFANKGYLKTRLHLAVRGERLKQFIGLFDYHVCFVEEIQLRTKELAIDVHLMCPYINVPTNIFDVRPTGFKSTFIYASGNITKYRRMQFNEFMNNSKELFKEGEFYSLRVTGKDLLAIGEKWLEHEKQLNSSNNESLRAFEVYVGQNEAWKYLSPMRIRRSFTKGSFTLAYGEYKESEMSSLVLTWQRIPSYRQAILDLSIFLSSVQANVLSYNQNAMIMNSNTLSEVRLGLQNSI